MKVSRGLLMFMRIAMLLQIIVGIGLWTGHLYGLIDIHRTIGVLFVLSLWIIAVIGMAQRRSVGSGGSRSRGACSSPRSGSCSRESSLATGTGWSVCCTW